MNLRRGLFRTWIVLTILWIGAALFISWPTVVRDLAFSSPPRSAEDFVTLIPVPCGEVRGQPSDYSRMEPGFSTAGAREGCYYEEPRLRELWPEYAAMTEDELIEVMHGKLGWTLPEIDPYEHTKRAALLALVPPVALLILGSLIIWAGAGYRRDSQGSTL
ncbi:MAG: hypothetical protein R3D70_05990 [Rhizobiaceae bacterium]